MLVVSSVSCISYTEVGTQLVHLCSYFGFPETVFIHSPIHYAVGVLMI